MVHDDPPAGEMPAVPTEAGDRAVVAEDVAAAYIADAVRGIPGIAALHGSHWKALSGRMRADSPTKGVVVRSVAPGVIEIDVHVKVGWGVVIPDLAVRSGRCPALGRCAAPRSRRSQDHAVRRRGRRPPRTRPPANPSRIPRGPERDAHLRGSHTGLAGAASSSVSRLPLVAERPRVRRERRAAATPRLDGLPGTHLGQRGPRRHGR